MNDQPKQDTNQEVVEPTVVEEAVLEEKVVEEEDNKVGVDEDSGGGEGRGGLSRLAQDGGEAGGMAAGQGRARAARGG